MDDLGVNFAPTGDSAANGPRNGQLSGVPQAIQILSLALPKFAGARAIAPQPLLTAPGGEGMDPSASALFATIMKTLGMHAASMGAPKPPDAGPNQLPFPGPNGNPFPRPPVPLEGTPAPFNPGPPRIVPIPNPVEPRSPVRGTGDGFTGPRRGQA